MRLGIVVALWLAEGAASLPYEVSHDNVERDMYCFCAEFECNCAYRAICKESAAAVLGWAEDVQQTCKASYMGKCFCHKSCVCDTEKFPEPPQDDSVKVPFTYSDGGSYTSGMQVSPPPPPPVFVDG